MAKPWQNKSGCNDPTAYAVEKRITEEEQRISELMAVLRYIVRLAGFEILNRIEFRDRRSGRVYK